MVSDPANRLILVYGGSSGFGDRNRTLTDTCEWRDGTWTQLAGEGPPIAHRRAVPGS